MNKSSIKKEMKASVGGAGYINQEQIKRHLGCGNEALKDYTAGLNFFKRKRTKYYAIDDVAGKVAEFIN